MNKPIANTKIRVLVTGVGGPAGINAVRLFNKHPQCEVVGADIDPLSAGRHFLRQFLISPRVVDKEGYRAWLLETIEKERIDICLPTVHEELVVVDEFRSKLPCYLVLSSHESIVVGDSKLACYAWMEKMMPEAVVPFTNLVDWTPDWSSAPEQFVKPVQGRGGRGCRVLSINEIADLQKNEKNPETLLVMALLPGTEWTVDAYRAKDGTMVYVVPRTRVGLAGGISIKGKTDRNQALIDLTTEMCEKLHVEGPVCVQWKADSAGVPKIVEINPRLSGGLPISVAGGIDPVQAIIAEYTNQQPTPQVWEEVTSVGYFEYKTI